MNKRGASLILLSASLTILLIIIAFSIDVHKGVGALVLLASMAAMFVGMVLEDIRNE